MNKAVKITKEALRQYAVASGDTSAIHLELDAAEQAGFERPIAHGMYIMGLAHSLYVSQHPTFWIKTSRMTFIRPLLVDTVACFDYAPVNDEIEITVTEKNGDLVARGYLTVREA
ncbi:MaoC family dehydratase [Paenibacillus senegalimassiliensis]|uniref:MaoC family dehydratase n=1 Tax=Paenibacillus senegalimassiliensis TaxID=1737426 RepID=UPI00073E92C0|nr:MaoC/PaaZ C-terminal domain-containing protein [Paenibacillus senegalimassiliensis]